VIFLTVGSALPFDRLVSMVDQAVADGLIKDHVFAQIGDGLYEPKHIEHVRFLPHSEYEATMAKAKTLISHAGIGTITSALQRELPMLVLPRSPNFGELVDDHQEKTAQAFARDGHLLTFHDSAELAHRYAQLSEFKPSPRNPNATGIAAAIGQFIRATCPPTTLEQI